MNQGTALPIVASLATRWAEWGGPLLTRTCGWSRRNNDRVRSAARNIHPRLSSGKARSAATSARRWRKRPGGLDERGTLDASGNDLRDRWFRRRSKR